MTNILLEGYDINAPWLLDALKKHIRPDHTVAVIALAFRDSRVKSRDDWNALYAKEGGCYYPGIAASFSDYGIGEYQIEFIKYFEDSPETAKQKIRNADLLCFPGGLPDRMLQRIREMQIEPPILRHEGILLGYSAGALIQLQEYHLSPDRDYPAFGYFSGLPFLEGFYLQVHYEGRPEQDEAIRRVLREKRKPVYATAFMKGALIVDKGKIEPVGEVFKFDP